MKNKKITQIVAFSIFRTLGFVIIAILFIILGFIIYQGVGTISWEFLTTPPTEGMTSGGIFPAIVGTLYLIIGSMIVSFPIGVMLQFISTNTHLKD